MLKPLFISVDPSRDTVAQLKHYSQDFHKDFEYLTGTKDQIAAVAKSYRVYFSKVRYSLLLYYSTLSLLIFYHCIQAVDADLDSDEEYLVDHSIVLYLVSPDGEFLDFFTQRMEVKDIVDRVIKHAEEYVKKQKSSK